MILYERLPGISLVINNYIIILNYDVQSVIGLRIAKEG